MGIEQLIFGGLIAIALTVGILSLLLLKDAIQCIWRRKKYNAVIERKMQILENIQQEIFSNEPLLSKVFRPNFGTKQEVKL